MTFSQNCMNQEAPKLFNNEAEKSMELAVLALFSPNLCRSAYCMYMRERQ